MTRLWRCPNLAQIVHPDDREAVAATSARIFETGRWEAVPHGITKPDGQVRWMLGIGRIFM